MFLQNLGDGAARIVTSASDLTAASKCEFAFLRRVDAKLGRDVVVPPDDDPMLARAATLGDAHEGRVLRGYRQELGAGVVEIPRPRSMAEAALAEVAEQTREALQAGAELVFQATFWDPEQRPAAGPEPAIAFVGFADFLRRMPDDAYEVQDAKLARRARVTALMQLAAYAEQLERIGVRPAPEAVLILGDDSRSVHSISEIAPVFRARRERLHRLLLDRLAAAAPLEWMSQNVTCCGRCEVCAPEVERTRDPLLIAGIRRTQRDALVDAGLTTIDAVAAAAGGAGIDGVTPQAFERLAWQAALQIDAVPGGPPPVRVIDRSAFAALPAPDPGDLFFDFEGDPMYLETARSNVGAAGRSTWGLDYLFGMVDTEERFTPLWAHDLAAEKQALLDFLSLVAERRSRHPGMHIYHYAPYERTHLLSIAARHGVGEAEVDELLREHVLVDLYPIVRRALRIGTRSYSIKKLEPLYMGDELRDEDGVTSGAQSVTEYAEASALLSSDEPEARDEARRRLDAIADYNRYDCVSTLRLRDWLLGLAVEHTPGLATGAPSPSVGEDGEEPDESPRFQTSAVATKLEKYATLASTERERQVIAMAASAIDYHQREQKSFWWEHFARLTDPIEDWAETKDVMVVDAAASVIEIDWFRMPRGRSDRREVRLSGEIAPGSSAFRPGAQVYALYDQPAPIQAGGLAPGSRVAKLVTVLEVHDDGVTVGETLPQGTQPYRVVPVALTPGPPPNAGAQKEAITWWGEQLVDALDRGTLPTDPAQDVLLRASPRPGGEVFSGEVKSPEHLVDAVTDTVASLDRGALPVQGPPGTGKTYLAAHVIERLVRERGWRIGVVAQSHKVVENVLAGVLRAGLPIEQVGKAPQAIRRITMSPEREAKLLSLADPVRQQPEAPTHPFTPLKRGGHSRFLSEHRDDGCVIGGTAWDFSNTDRVRRRELDLLVIDEAGQFSLAPTIAASVSAERLLLLGDPQQLPQVSQGAHPEPVDVSALGWVLDGRDTIPEDMGFFLAETRRMRPELAEVVSELAYGGRLRAHPSASERELQGVGPAGLVWHPVSHRGNSTHSPEEAAEVVRIVGEILGGGTVSGGALTQADLIVVAAYNAQVECVSSALAAAGFGAVRVGTVDKFQGQEAAIAIVTLAASSPDEVPRGLEFLLMRNRLNVAISRAQWAAHLVSSDRLGDGLPASAGGIAALSGYLRLLEHARPAGDTLEA